MMRKIFLLIFLWVALGAWTDLGLNVRSSVGYVTDGTDEVFCGGQSQDAYPTTRGGATFGWDAGYDNGRDRDSANDRRLAGMAYHANDGNQSTLRVDLPSAGTYDFRLAMGDATQAPAYQRIDVYDDSTLLLTVIESDGTAANSFVDATGAELTAANWPASNAAVQLTFSTTIAYIKIGSTSAESNSTALAHVRFTQAASGNLPLLQAIGEE